MGSTSWIPLGILGSSQHFGVHLCGSQQGFWGPLLFGVHLMDPIGDLGSPPIWGPPHDPMGDFGVPLNLGSTLGSHQGFWGHPTILGSPPIWGNPHDPIWGSGGPLLFGVHLGIPWGIWGPLQFGVHLMNPMGDFGVPSNLGSTSRIPLGILGSPHQFWGPPHGSHWVFWGHPPPIPLPIPPRPGCGAVVNQIPHTSTQVGRNLPEHCGPPAAGGAISALMSN